ncbi:protein GPR108 [Gadus chalcogrammus]|uniref:protein GPR108 n=1 Tax=Gadus chalcogrammus TaxID=1042646 RepID=UPI0024C269BD|nr:protein GPR108 [Gadus chalcogrammus]
MANRGLFFGAVLLLHVLCGCDARIHTLELKNDTRSIVHLNTFGFNANGSLDVKLLSLSIPDNVDDQKYPVGFSISKSRVNGVLSYTAEEPKTCPLTLKESPNDQPVILFIIDMKMSRVIVRPLGLLDYWLRATMKSEDGSVKDESVRKTRETPEAGAVVPNPLNPTLKDGVQKETKIVPTGQQTVATAIQIKAVTPKPAVDEDDGIQLEKGKEQIIALDKVNGNFHFNITFGPLAEGLYNLNFHYCLKKVPGVDYPYSLSVAVREVNPGGYLSAAEIPLPRLYICMAGVFFTAALIWVYTLMKHRYSVFKIHWLMAALAFTKAVSLVFHSINFHFINTKGHPIEGWAVMYYITHLLKGALLFITLALIGTGWAFVKYILSDKEKKIFMIVIPLQVLANIAFIIIESGEEGSSEYALWKEILFLVDLLCCGAILFPVVWSIRHLQEASSTDGKAAMNLEKLKLFRHYYVMIVCYIYFTRIIAILLKVTMPFQWQWCYEFLVEVSTLIFFVLTGYKFRPASNNPYLQLPLDEEDVEMDEVVTESGALEGITKVKKTSNGRERQRESTL